ncbi:HAD family hydrolase [Longirhabdus pacifica]|uniref:HAD family hydrolase n=1 Tax=Longirhabdus pacifica TaxID=2305227 RepID=UPI0013E89962|nr:HAD family hydrolase [Longirhabdus pacifica]
MLFRGENKKVIFFDVSNTLVHMHRSFMQCASTVYEDFTGRLDQAPSAEGFIQQFQSTYKKSRQEKGRTLPIAKARMVAFQKTLQHNHLPINPPLVQQMLRQIKKQLPEHYVLYEDVEPTLFALSNDYKLGIISNHGKFDVSKSRLAPYISSSLVYTPENTGYRKPSRNIFRNALKQSGFHAKEAVMVGDLWKTDILGAVQSGMHAVWLQRRKKRNKKLNTTYKKSVTIIHQLNDLV